MSLRTETDQIVSVLAALTTQVSALTAAVSALPTSTGTPANNDAILAAIATLQTTVTDIQGQVDEPAAPAPDAAPVTPAPAVAPAPAPETAPEAPAADSAPETAS